MFLRALSLSISLCVGACFDAAVLSEHHREVGIELLEFTNPVLD